MKDFLETWTMQVKQWQNATKIVALYPAIPFRPRYDVSECASAQALRSKAGIYRMMWSNMLSMFGKDLHCFAISCYHGVQNNVHWHTPSINQWLHMSSLSDTYANSYIYIYMYQTYYLCCWLFPTWDKPKDCGRQFSGFSCSSFKFGENAADSGNSWCVVTQNFLFVKSRSNFSFNALILSNVEYR